MRLFLAAELPDELRRVVRELLAALPETLCGWRWARPDSVHLTLRFLGEVDAAREGRNRERWARLAREAQPFRLLLTELGCFPPRGSPRVLWVGVEETRPGGALERLAHDLELAAQEGGWAAERRLFRPHLTLARRARTGRVSSPTGSVERAQGWVRRLTLMRSHLEPGGARYTAMASFPLGSAGAADG